MEPKKESVLLIPVPEAEGVASPWRDKYDPVMKLGVPAHITLIYPFLKPDLIDERVINQLADFFINVPDFEFSLTGIGTFPQGVIFIQPYPKKPLIDLVEKLEKTFGIPPV